MIGSPLAGDRMLLVDIISARASSWASRVSGTWTAIWSPSKSALYAAQTSGCSWMALPSINTGSKAWIPRRCSVGARLSSTGRSRMTSGRMAHTSGSSRSTIFLAALMVVARPRCSSLPKMDGLNSSRAIVLGRPHWCSRRLGPTAPVRTPGRTRRDARATGVVHALAPQVLTDATRLGLDRAGQGRPRALVGAGDGTAGTAVVQQCVDGFLRDAVFVAQDAVP